MSENPVVLITGASGRLGSAVVEKFATIGCRFILCDLKFGSHIFETLTKLKYTKDQFLAESTDVTNVDSVKAVVNKAYQQFGRLDALIHIAGTWRGGSPVHQTDLKTWDLLMDINAKSVLVLARAVIPYMERQERGVIITIGSRNVVQISKNNGAYTAAKTATVRLTQTIAAELLHTGIRANSILLSILDTPRNRENMSHTDFTTWVKPESAAEIIFFLTSEAARDISGAVIPVYGRVD